jgi:haloacid dehalogenase superfamily, subfamily IA, variant 1 with third motif having Dx(3-4)D or Dx(3-4)E
VNDEATSLGAILSAKSALLLDFDGPVCQVFAHIRDRDVAADLRARVDRFNIPMPRWLTETADPLLVLRWVDRLGSSMLTRTVIDTLIAAETRAADSAVPTPGGHEVITAASAVGRKVAIVSNNSEEAVWAYLRRHGLTPHVHLVASRYATMPPSLMKPDPHLVYRALEGLRIAADTAVLVGDSATDIQAARAAGVTSVGFAVAPDKAAILERENADAIVTSMSALASVLRTGRIE